MSICSSKMLAIPTNLRTISSSSSSSPTNRSHLLFNNCSSNDTMKVTISASCPCCGVYSHLPIRVSRARRSERGRSGHRHRLVASASDSASSSLPESVDDDQKRLEQQIREAQEAISEFLQGFNVSRDEALFISANSPKYLQMLIDGARELDDLALWNFQNNTAVEQISDEDGDCSSSSSSFKEKILYLAKQKGDNGKFAFLESLGLSLNSAMNVTRYLSSQPLPNLIHKVKYMKEMLFSCNDDERPIGKMARDMMMHLSIPIDEDLQLTLSIFEKIEARRGGLNMLGTKDASFRYLVESFPRILLLSVDSRIKPMVEFLKEIGVPEERMSNLLLLFPPIMFCNIEVLKTRVMTYEKLGAVGEDVGKMLSKYPWILSTSIQENIDEIFSFFENEKVPRAKVEHAIISWPNLLGCSTDKLKLMVEQFGELGVYKKRLGQVIAKSPQLLVQKPEEFLLVVSFFEYLGFDWPTIGSLVGRCPEVFNSSTERTLTRKLQFLTDIGVPEDRFPKVIKKYPEFLVLDVDNTLIPRINFLRREGLSKGDIASMIWRFSPILGYSVDEVLRPKLEFLENTMERPVSDVVDYPRYFSYDLDKKIKPRFWVLEGQKVKCSLQDMLAKNDEEFAADYMGIGSLLVSPLSSNQ